MVIFGFDCWEICLELGLGFDSYGLVLAWSNAWMGTFGFYYVNGFR
jgi:hypothetical protein